MKPGERVKVIDGSYSLIRINGKMQRCSGIKVIGMGEWKIIATGLDLDAENTLGSQRNDTVIQAYDGTIAWIQERFLIPAT